ncbi:MAG: hypothetical protein ACREFH_16420, partial [Stellaceae bacterium]
ALNKPSVLDIAPDSGFLRRGMVRKSNAMPQPAIEHIGIMAQPQTQIKTVKLTKCARSQARHPSN